MIDNSNNGLITKIWGPSGWIFNHSVTFGYPINPTPEQKKQYKNYFLMLGNILPCKYCRTSYNHFINTGKTALTDKDLENRDSLSRWFYRIHEAVNQKLEIEYGITFEQVAEKYESFRAKCGPPIKTSKGCITPLDMKAFSFEKLYYLDAPIISFSKANYFYRYAKTRELSKKYFYFFQLLRKVNGDIERIKTMSIWQIRNNKCQNNIRKMRIGAIPSIEESGIWQGLPTRLELKLILMVCSNLNRTELSDVIRKVIQFEQLFKK